jgi:hypothetical protein
MILWNEEIHSVSCWLEWTGAPAGFHGEMLKYFLMHTENPDKFVGSERRSSLKGVRN